MMHWLAHRLGWNLGRVVTQYDDDGVLWVAFECAKCGATAGACRATFETARLKA